METIPYNEVIFEDRVRKDLGDLNGLISSIKEFGIIQPIVLAKTDSGGARLIAGGRRFTSLGRLNFKELRHGKEFIWRDEVSSGQDYKTNLRLGSIELEENLKRKELTWQEQVEGKAKLLKIMQLIHGEPTHGGATREEKSTGVRQGFGVNKLAAMLGESAGSVSQDLKIASVMEHSPLLKKQPTKESAMRLLKTVVNVSALLTAGANPVNANGEAEPDWIIYEGDFAKNSHLVLSETVDLVYSDLPFGVDLSKMSHHSGGTIGYADPRSAIIAQLDELCSEAYRMLKDNRFVVFWFGFNYYPQLIAALEKAGFKPNLVPFIWFKNTRSTENPNTRYGNSYDPAIIASKGSPMFIRPGQQNFVQIPPVIGQDKIQVAQQPVALVERFIKDMTVENAVICDLTAGSGTTGVAALENKRKAILFEKEPGAIFLAKARLAVIKK